MQVTPIHCYLKSLSVASQNCIIKHHYNTWITANYKLSMPVPTNSNISIRRLDQKSIGNKTYKNICNVKNC